MSYYLKQIYDDLSYGELSQVNLAHTNSECACGEWDNHAKKVIVSHLTMALTDLHTRFPLREKEVTVQLYPHITQYQLSSKYARSNIESTEPYKYIIDSIYYPFEDDVLRIERCSDEAGIDMRINDANDGYSIFTPDYRSIQVPFPEDGYALFLGYRANHKAIVTDYTDEATVDIEIPPYLYEAVLYYIAYRVHKSRSNQEAQAESLRLFQLYNQACDKVDRMNITHNSSADSNLLLDDNGWI